MTDTNDGSSVRSSPSAVQVALALLGFGREELEREDGRLGGEDLVDAHPLIMQSSARAHRRCGARRRCLQVRQVGEDLRQQPVRVLLRERVAVARAARPRTPSAAPRRAAASTLHSRSLDERAVALDVGVHVGEGAPVPGQAQARAEPLHDVERAAGTPRPGRASSRSRSTARCAPAGGRRRPAGAARAGTGTRARARARASHRRSTRPGRWRARPIDQVAVGLDQPGDPDPARVCAARRSGAAAPRGRRSGARPPAAARTRPRGPRPCASCARGWGASTARSRRARAIVAAWPQWSEWACVQTTRRTCSSRRSHIASARSRLAIESGWCMPVSNSTKPSPALTAQALQCGTPGQGSGKRRRNTPGSTRSPRPSSRLLSDIGHAAETRLRLLQRRKGDGMAERRRERGEHEGAGGRRERPAGGRDAQTHLGQQGRGRRAPLLRRDRRPRPRGGRVAVGARAGARTYAARSTRSRRRACARSSAS